MDRGGDEDGGDLVDGKGAEWAFCSLGVSGSKDGRKTSRKATSHGQSIMHPMDNPMDNPMVNLMVVNPMVNHANLPFWIILAYFGPPVVDEHL